MVGGAISGYCAMGRVESAITPTSVITMLITPAKIGRSMKKCGKFIGPSSALRISLLRNGLHFHSGLHQLETRRHHLLTVFQSVFHDSFAFKNPSSLDRA